MYLIVEQIAAIASLISLVAARVEIADFIPFGGDLDNVLHRNDDQSSVQQELQPISEGFSFFGNSQSALWVNTNGGVSFLNAISQYTPNCNPVSQNYMMISPFWADVDTRYYGPGEVYYRETTASRDLAAATRDVRRAFPSLDVQPMRWAYVVTWHRVTFYGAQTSQSSRPGSARIAASLDLETGGGKGGENSELDEKAEKWGVGGERNPVGPLRKRRQIGPTTSTSHTTTTTTTTMPTIPIPLPENTFQLVLATDGRYSFAIFNYNAVVWTTGTASGGDGNTGLGGSPARAGFDAGDQEHFYMIEKSCQDDIVDLPGMTNVGVPGKFVFRIDGDQIIAANVTSVTPDPEVCSGHGHCECDHGYTGVNCDKVVDFCNSTVSCMPSLGTWEEACGENGQCESVEGVGATCICDEGWYGPFCQHRNESCLVAPRCLAYPPTIMPHPLPQDPLPVGCPTVEQTECIPDDLNCLLDRDCPYPIGWCIPRARPLASFVTRLAAFNGVKSVNFEP